MKSQNNLILEKRIQREFENLSKKYSSFNWCKSERSYQIVQRLREKFKLKDILKASKLPKSTYMYWQRKSKKINTDSFWESEILKIRRENPCFGYRRIWASLRRKGFKINKKKVHRLTKKLKLQIYPRPIQTSNYSSYRGECGKAFHNILNGDFS